MPKNGWDYCPDSWCKKKSNESHENDKNNESHLSPRVQNFCFFNSRPHHHCRRAALLSPIPVAPTISEGWTTPRQGQYLIHGRLMRSPETCVKWTINENDVFKDGIYEQPCFAIVVRYRPERRFVMAVGCKATTYGGLAVVREGSKERKCAWCLNNVSLQFFLGQSDTSGTIWYLLMSPL